MVQLMKSAFKNSLFNSSVFIYRLSSLSNLGISCLSWSLTARVGSIKRKVSFFNRLPSIIFSPLSKFSFSWKSISKESFSSLGQVPPKNNLRKDSFVGCMFFTFSDWRECMCRGRRSKVPTGSLIEARLMVNFFKEGQPEISVMRKFGQTSLD